MNNSCNFPDGFIASCTHSLYYIFPPELYNDDERMHGMWLNFSLQLSFISITKQTTSMLLPAKGIYQRNQPLLWTFNDLKDYWKKIEISCRFRSYCSTGQKNMQIFWNYVVGCSYFLEDNIFIPSPTPKRNVAISY